MIVCDVITWILIGGANRLVIVAPDQPGGVTGPEAFKLLATEWGRHVRGFAQQIVHTWR